MRRSLSLAVAVLRDPAGRMLVVRKRGTAVFMQPGGKIEPGESPAEALLRELHEELGVELDIDRLTPLGQAEAPAAHEPDCDLRAEIFAISGQDWGDFALTAEIEEARWVSNGDTLPLAPLTEEKIMPMIWH